MEYEHIHMLGVDPQNDFCDIPESELPPGRRSALPVPGSDGDMKRAETLVNRISRRVERFHISRDRHSLMHIRHPIWWKNRRGDFPAPGTVIPLNDIRSGEWTTCDPKQLARSIAYVEGLGKCGRVLRLWPPHCLKGTWGEEIHPALKAALERWTKETGTLVDYIFKGRNPWTDSPGALIAEVPDPKDPSTELNVRLLDELRGADIVGAFGEAGSHCFMDTLDQIADNIGEEHIKKFHIITDCISPLGAVPDGPDFPAIYREWLLKMEKRGMTLTTSTEFLK